MDMLTAYGAAANTGHANVPVPLFAAIALVAGGLILILARSGGRSQSLGKRLELTQPRALPAGARAGGKPDAAQRGKVDSGWYSAGLSDVEQLQIVRSFSFGGLQPESAVAAFTAVRMLLTAGAAIAGFLLAPANKPLLPVLFGAIGAIGGWLVPVMYIKMKLKRHIESVGNGLPEALELLAVCVDAGLSLDGGLQRVSAELQISQPALAEELARTWAEIAIMPSREEALMNLALRVNLPAVRSVAGTLTQSLRLGTPLAQSLRSAAAEMRNDQLTELEEKASQLPALLTIPVMLFILPTIFLIVAGPAALRIADLFAQAAAPH